MGIQTSPKIKDISGETFGELTVLRQSEPPEKPDGSAYWLCRCVCGEELVVSRRQLRQKGRVRCRTCGPYEQHGSRKTPEYTSWYHMIERCSDENCEGFKNYGGRGITFAPHWRSFSGFIADMGPMPGRGFTIERIDVNGNYEPSNCIWLLKSLQSRNTRRNKLNPDLVKDLLIAKSAGVKVRHWARQNGIPESAAYRAASGDTWTNKNV